MRIVIAPDSFKECLPAREVARAIAEGCLAAWPEAEIDLAPMADGGEGTVEALVDAAHGKLVAATVTGPLGEPVEAEYGLIDSGQMAVIEMAKAAGLALVPRDRRDPRITTTFGVGELMAHALEQGVLKIIVGVGGSATNDGGAGVAQALGYSLKDTHGAELEFGGAALVRLAKIDIAGRNPKLNGCEIRVACDVDNPLCGPHGASHVYGPQKGATDSVAHELDGALANFGRVVENQLGAKVLDLPGAGAAGGLAAGLVAFAGAALKPGIGLVADACDLSDRVQDADLVITGEGRMDGQTIFGKLPVGVAAIAKEHGKPVIALAGALGPGYEAVYAHGIDGAYSITPAPMDLCEATETAFENLKRTAEAVMRTWRAAQAHDR